MRRRIEPEELNLLRSGLYNAGFLGLRRTDQTRAFVTWFKERLERFCLDDRTVGHPRGLFVDQLWLNLVPVFFKDVSLPTAPGRQLGPLEHHGSRAREGLRGALTSDGEPLLFVHFSGWDLEKPARVSRFASVSTDRISPLWSALATAYRERLLSQDYATAVRHGYAFASFANGQPITREDRVRYYNDLANGAAPSGSPFAAYEHFHPPT